MELCSNISTLTLPIDTYYIYIVDAGLIILLATILVIIILKNEKYREQKEYILIMATLLHELIYGIAWFSIGVFRLFMSLNDKSKDDAGSII
jgi:hypothetical protein